MSLALAGCSSSPASGPGGSGGGAGSGAGGAAGTGTGGSAGSGGSGGAPLGPPYTGPAGQWVDRTPDPIPRAWPGGDAVVAVDDSSRGKLVVFTYGIGYSTRTMQVWDWDGKTQSFTDRTPKTVPANWQTSFQGVFQAAYDPARKVVVLYGTAEAPNPVTIEYDPDQGSFVDVTISKLGFNTTGDYAFYDAGLGGVVLYGADAAFPQHLLVWDPSSRTWTTSSIPGAPPPSEYVDSMAYDAARRKVYAFGEAVSSASLPVAELDVATGAWTSRGQLNAADKPLVAAYDSARGRVVFPPDPSGTPPATFEWDPATGTTKELDVGTIGTADKPETVYDSASGHVTALDESGQGEYMGELATWDGATWTSHVPKHIALPWPVVSQNAYPGSISLAYDASRGRTVAVVKSPAGEAVDATLEWDGTRWTDVTPSDPAKSPPARTLGAMAFDASRNRVVLFGSDAASGFPLHDLWEWDGTAWTNRTPSPLPSAWPQDNSPTSMVYDPKTKTVLLVSNGGDSTWSWDGNAGTMTPLQPTDSLAQTPLGPNAWALSYDDRLGVPVMVSVGGAQAATVVWTFDRPTLSWHQVQVAGTPPSFGMSVACAYDRVRDRVLVTDGFGVESFDMGQAKWSDVTPSPLPALWPDPASAADPLAGAVYDVQRSRFVVLLESGLLVERPSR